MCNWVRVEDRLPELIEYNTSEYVFVWVAGHATAYKGYLEGDTWMHEDGDTILNGVTHWATITPPGEER